MRQERLILDRLCLLHLLDKPKTPAPSQKSVSASAPNNSGHSFRRPSSTTTVPSAEPVFKSPSKPQSSRVPSQAAAQASHESEYDWPPTPCASNLFQQKHAGASITSPLRSAAESSPNSVSLAPPSRSPSQRPSHPIMNLPPLAPPGIGNKPNAPSFTPTLSVARDLSRNAHADNQPKRPALFPTLGESEPLDADLPSSPALRAPPRTSASTTAAKPATHADLAAFAFTPKRRCVPEAQQAASIAPEQQAPIQVDDMEWPDLEDDNSAELFKPRSK